MKPRNILLFLAGGLCLLLSLFWLGYLDRNDPAEIALPPVEDTKSHRGRLAVLYFENTTDPEDGERLGQMLTNLLTTALARTPEFEVITPQRLYDAAVRFGGVEAGNRSRAHEIARHLKLDTMVLGKVTHGAEILVVDAEMIDVESGILLGTRRREGRDLNHLFAVVDALGEQVHEALETPRTAAAPERPLSAELTTSVKAYRAYVAGEDLLHRHDFSGAMENFQTAVAIDPKFALAHYRLSNAATWLGAQDEARTAALRAAALGEGFAPIQRDLFRAAVLFQEGRFSELLTKVEALLVEDPENKEALFYAAEIYLHSGLEANPARATEAMLVLDALDPDFLLLGNHLVLALVVQGRWEEANDYLDAWVAAEPEKEDLRPVARALGNRLDEVPFLPRPLVRVNDSYRVAITMLQGRWAEARQLVFEDAGVGYNRSWRLRNRATLLAYSGDFDSAAKAYRESASFHAPTGNEGIQNGMPGSSHQGLAELLVLAQDLAGARQQAAAALRLQPWQPSAHYYAGRLARLAGDVAALEDHLRKVRQAAARSRGVMTTLFEEALDAELDLAEGRAERARSRYERVVGSGTLLHDFYAAASSSGALFRDGLATACRAQWDQSCEARALRGLLVSGFERLDHPVLYVRALFRLGELHLEGGEEALAREYFERFLTHWGDTTWHLSEVTAAREHLAR